MKRSKFDYRDVSNFVLAAIVAGGLFGGTALLLQLGFEKDATFAFLGAIVGAAVAVGLTLAQEGRMAAKEKKEEKSRVLKYVEFATDQLKDKLSVISTKKVEYFGALNEIYYSANSTISYVDEVIQHGKHFIFGMRASLRELKKSMEILQTTTSDQIEIAEGFGASPNLDEIATQTRNSLNALAVLKSSFALEY